MRISAWIFNRLGINYACWKIKNGILQQEAHTYSNMIDFNCIAPLLWPGDLCIGQIKGLAASVIEVPEFSVKWHRSYCVVLWRFFGNELVRNLDAFFLWKLHKDEFDLKIIGRGSTARCFHKSDVIVYRKKFYNSRKTGV